jgi:hypothetical protein
MSPLLLSQGQVGTGPFGLLGGNPSTELQGIAERGIEQAVALT